MLWSSMHYVTSLENSTSAGQSDIGSCTVDANNPDTPNPKYSKCSDLSFPTSSCCTKPLVAIKCTYGSYPTGPKWRRVTGSFFIDEQHTTGSDDVHQSEIRTLTGLGILYLNVNYLLSQKRKTKIKFLQEYCIENNIAIIAITETWLTDRVSDAEIEIFGFTIFCGFSKFYKNLNFFVILIIHKPSLGSCEVPQKIWPKRYYSLPIGRVHSILNICFSNS